MGVMGRSKTAVPSIVSSSGRFGKLNNSAKLAQTGRHEMADYSDLLAGRDDCTN